MRGDDLQQQAMFSYISPEARVPKDIHCVRFRSWLIMHCLT